MDIPLPSATLEPRRVYLTPGSMWCGEMPTVVSTVLGSCISVCLMDRQSGAAGMNHFVLPAHLSGGHSLRYGDVAMDALFSRMMRLGCDPDQLRAKVFGGANVLPFSKGSDTVGTQNTRIALEWLRQHSIPIISQRTGGSNGLLIRFHTGSGRVMVRKLTSEITTSIDEHAAGYDSRRIGSFGS
jgi:chemotaxis protein CheD